MRPIDADALLEKVEKLETYVVNDYEWCLEDRITVELEQVENLIEEAPTVEERPRGEWISVEDRLPDPFVTVLVHMPQEDPLPTVHAGYISKDGEWVGGMFNRDKDEVTHWMPLPEAPDMRGEGE